MNEAPHLATHCLWRPNRVHSQRDRIRPGIFQGRIGMWLVAGTLVCIGCGDPAPGAAGDRGALATWSIDPVPSLRLGATMDDTTQLFAVVIGATRLPDGRILVADRNDQAFQLYAPDGTHLRGYGRQGTGPGEFQYPARFWRCGDSVLVYDINGYQTSVFGLDGTFTRTFRFGAGAQGSGQTPYRSACNGSGLFAHFGWSRLDFRPGDPTVFRPKVPFWTSGADSMVGIVLDSFPGSERVVSFTRDGRPAGDGPRMFGKQTAIAMGSDRLFIGTAERPEIFVVKLDDLSIDTIHLGWTPTLLTPEAVAAEKAVRLATSPADRHAGIERDFAEHPFPDTLPPYSDLLVDSEDMLWVRGVPAAAGAPVRWTVVAASGVPTAIVELPDYLTVFEVGHDYVLGRYVDPIESIPEVRMYRLSRR